MLRFGPRILQKACKKNNLKVVNRLLKLETVQVGKAIEAAFKKPKAPIIAALLAGEFSLNFPGNFKFLCQCFKNIKLMSVNQRMLHRIFREFSLKFRVDSRARKALTKKRIDRIMSEKRHFTLLLLSVFMAKVKFPRNFDHSFYICHTTRKFEKNSKISSY
jgi:hypothetical protein